MAASEKPLLLLDIDGVLSPLTEPEGYIIESVGFRMAFHPQLKQWCQNWLRDFEIVWATSWMEEANASLAQVIGLPPLQVIRFDKQINDKWYQENEINTGKLPFIEDFLSDYPHRPVIWCEDDLGAEAFAWSKQRNKQAPTLLIKPDRDVGLTEADVEQINNFVIDLKFK